MCIFTGEVRAVSSTRIFARLDESRQCVAYAMRFAADADLAMVLPLPVPPGTRDGAVTFVDLQGVPDLFDRLGAGFPPVVDPNAGMMMSGGLGIARQTLEVHVVGAFEASFVPSIADFERLDPRFRLSPGVWAQVPGYEGYGFAVFKLSPKPRARGSWFEMKLGGRSGLAPDALDDVHPMAFWFPTRHPDRLFFPTLHIHDGAVRPTATFDHLLYYQVPAGKTLGPDRRTHVGSFVAAADEPPWSGPVTGTRADDARVTAVLSMTPVERLVPIEQAHGLLVEGECYRERLAGSLENRDTWLTLATGAKRTRAAAAAGETSPDLLFAALTTNPDPVRVATIASETGRAGELASATLSPWSSVEQLLDNAWIVGEKGDVLRRQAAEACFALAFGCELEATGRPDALEEARRWYRCCADIALPTQTFRPTAVARAASDDALPSNASERALTTLRRVRLAARAAPR